MRGDGLRCCEAYVEDVHLRMAPCELNGSSLEAVVTADSFVVIVSCTVL
jgi:hypothetical protein